MAREGSANEPECEQTLKLVRAFIEYGGLKYINQGIVRAVVAIAEQMDNRLRNVSLETLAELGKHDKRLSSPLANNHAFVLQPFSILD